MRAYTRLFTVDVRHAFDGDDSPCPRVEFIPLNTNVLTQHRLISRSSPGVFRLGCAVDHANRPRFGLPRGVDVALVAADSVLQNTTRWPAGSQAPRPTSLIGLARQAIPLFVASCRGGVEPVNAQPAPWPVWPAPRPIRWTMQSGETAQASHADALNAHERQPDLRPGREPETIDALLTLASEPRGLWILAIAGIEYRLWSGKLPPGTVAILRIVFAPDYSPPGPQVTLALETSADVWSWRVIPSRAAGAFVPAAFSIDHPAVAVGPAAATHVGGQPAASFQTLDPIPWRARTPAFFTLWHTDAFANRRMVVERLPTPSPSALRPVVDIYL